MIDLNQHKLELDYPCSWVYKLVVLESINIKKVVISIVGERQHTLKASKTSSKGKYKSHALELIVHSDDDRKELHKLLGDHSDIKMII